MKARLKKLTIKEFTRLTKKYKSNSFYTFDLYLSEQEKYFNTLLEIKLLSEFTGGNIYLCEKLGLTFWVEEFIFEKQLKLRLLNEI
jgi:hypothetical protein